MKNPNTSLKDESIPPSIQAHDEIAMRTEDEFDYSQCSSIKSMVYKSGDKLVFQDIEHLENCAICLEQDYNSYNDQYDSQYPNATAEQLDSIDSINNFDEWTPYLIFEQGLSFSSLRAKIEIEINTWLSSTPADSINFDDDPDDSVPLFDESTRALFNENGLVIIGNEVKSMSEFEDGSVYDFFVVANSCSFWKDSDYTFDYNDTPLLENRQLKMKIAVRSGIVSSKLIGKIKHYKKINGNYKLRRAKLKIGVAGYSFDIDCDEKTQGWVKWEGYKNRKKLTVTSRIWNLWREAITDRNDQRYLAKHCIAHGYYINDTYYFPIWLYN